MSSSEDAEMDWNDSGSDGEAFVKPKKVSAKTKPSTKASTKAPAKTKSLAPKGATKGKASKKQVLTDHNDTANDSALDVDGPSDASDGEKRPNTTTQERAAGPSKKKTVSETYTKLSQLDHILIRPDSYIGSVETITQAMWTYDAESKRMAWRDVKYVPGFFKIVDEILVNAADNKINDPNMDTLKVTIDVAESTISVYNNGKGIPIEMHSQEKMYIPELIFGHLLSSSNYDDDEKKLTGGRNGYGAKLANIYSHEFTVETADKNTSQKYKQTWTKNMSICGKPKITKNAKGEEWTRVTFRPDLKRFGMESIDDDTAGLLRKRVYDMAGTIKDVKVFLDDERLKIKNFKQYMEMYLSAAQAAAEDKSSGAAQPKQTIVHEQLGARWEVGFALSEGNFQHVSFANSISTTKGGTHVTYISDQIAKNLMNAIVKKNKAATVKPAQIKNHMWIFVNALIENPTFDSQTKETLTLPASKFGTKPTLTEEFMKKVQKSGIIDNILNWAKFKADQQNKKTDGTKRTRLLGMTKLSDANNAGSRYAKDCTLILTEGDSAKALAVAGLGVVGRDNFGVFPLRGKLLNVREAKHDQIMKNEEIQNIKKIMGLQHNKDYTDASSLRYGQLMIMTDQDHDGSHIKGLLINFLDHFYPSLLKIPGFLVEFVTPIVRVTKGTKRKDFFTIPEYEQWLLDTPDASKWDSKYYKGLGTSTDDDARDYFSHMAKHMIPFAATQEGDRELIELAFSKKKADERKEWLRQFKPGTYLDHRIEEIPYSEFVNKELILFSMADNVRSIPAVADGLKPGQRKVLWGCFKRKMKKEVKVAQLVGYISEHAAYHHGEVSLMMTIVNLAQTFVGSNNINLLEPKGQYGTRALGGKDHASARYILTLPTVMARKLYHPDDDPLLTQQKEDNALIEPEFYMPVLPMVLINGAEGIGTGWSTNIPCYNPTDIVANIRRLMAGEELVPMVPWWRGFTGEIKPTAKHKYDVTGVARKTDDTTVEITELPIHKWTQPYKAELEAMILGEKGDGKEGLIKEYREHHANSNVHFTITMGAKELEKAEQQGLVEFFKLTGKLSTSNMICFDFDGNIKRYDSPEEIIEEFYPVRLAYYQKRKDFLANELQTAFEKLTNQARFIQMIVDKQLVVSNRKKIDIVQDLRKHKFRPFPKVSKAKAAGEAEDAEEEEAEEEQVVTTADVNDYDYLLGMAIWSLTREKIERLKQQAVEKEAELMILLKRNPISMWNDDLDEFLKQWEIDCEAFKNATSTGVAGNGKGKKRKPAVLKTRKSIGAKNNSDDDDDFKPIKSNLAKKPAAPRKPSAPAKQEESSAKARAAPKRKVSAPKKAAIKDDSDSDVEMVEEARAPTKQAAASKDSGSDDEKPPARKSKPVMIKDSDDSDDEVLSSAKGKGKAKAKPQTTSKRKSIGDGTEEGSDDEFDLKPPKKSKMTTGQSSVTDFFGTPNLPSKKPTAASSSQPAVARKVSKTQSMKPKSPPKPKKTTAAAKKLFSSKANDDGDDDDDDDNDDVLDYDKVPKATARAAPTRTARAAAASKKYIEIPSDDDGDVTGGGDESMFVDDD